MTRLTPGRLRLGPLLALLAALSLAGFLVAPRSHASDPDQIVVIDLSRSSSSRPEEGVRATLDALPSLGVEGRGRLAIVGFGRQPVVLRALEEGPLGAAERQRIIERARALPPEFRDGSQLAAALEAVRGLGGERPVEILVLGDGRGRGGAAAMEAALARERSGRLRYRPPLSPRPEDLRLEAFDQPPLIAGSQTTLELHVRGTIHSPREIIVAVGEEHRRVSIDPGDEPLLRFTLRPPEGSQRIAAAIVDPGGVDGWPGNDRVLLPVIGKKRVVGILGGPADRIEASLGEAGFEIAWARESGVASPGELAELDVLILIDWALPRAWEVAPLEEAVREAGLGLLVCGGPHAFRAGGYGASPDFDALLPLSSRLERPRDLCVLLDRSGTMAQGRRLDRAREAILRLVDRLDPRDRIAILPFAGAVDTALGSGFEPPDEFRRLRVESLLRLQASGPTRVVPALSAGFAMDWDSSKRRERLLILISDLFDEALPPKVAELRGEARRLEIEIVTLLLDESGGGGEDRFPLAQALGRARRVRDISSEVLLGLVERAGWKPAELKFSGRGDYAGVKGTLRAFNPTVLGEGARLLAESEEKGPLLAFARRGAGRVLAFGSDIRLDPFTRELAAGFVAKVAPPVQRRLRCELGSDGHLWLHGKLPPGAGLRIDGDVIPWDEQGPQRFRGPPVASIPKALSQLDLRDGRGDPWGRFPLPPFPDAEYRDPPLGPRDIRLRGPSRDRRRDPLWLWSASAFLALRLLLAGAPQRKRRKGSGDSDR